MYSYEERIRAVKLCKRTGPTIRQLGYPTKNSLKSWHREFEQSRDLQAGYVRSRQKYSAEHRRVASPFTTVAASLSTAGYDSIKSFTLVGMIASGPLVWATNHQTGH